MSGRYFRNIIVTLTFYFKIILLGGEILPFSRTNEAFRGIDWCSLEVLGFDFLNSNALFSDAFV